MGKRQLRERSFDIWGQCFFVPPGKGTPGLLRQGVSDSPLTPPVVSRGTRTDQPDVGSGFRAISIHVVQDFLLEGIQAQFAGLVVCNDRFLNRQNLSLGTIAGVIAEPAVCFVNDDEVHILTRLDYG